MGIQRYTTGPYEVEAIALNQFGDFVRAAAWVTESGGRAYFSPNDQMDCLLLVTPDGSTLDGYEGSVLVLDIDGTFTLWDGGQFDAAHTPIVEAAAEEGTKGFTGTGYVAPSRKGGAHLVGGATLPLPNG